MEVQVWRRPECRMNLYDTLYLASSHCYCLKIVSMYLFRVVCVLSDVLVVHVEDKCKLTCIRACQLMPTPERKTDITTTFTWSVVGAAITGKTQWAQRAKWNQVRSGQTHCAVRTRSRQRVPGGSWCSDRSDISRGIGNSNYDIR